MYIFQLVNKKMERSMKEDKPSFIERSFWNVLVLSKFSVSPIIPLSLRWSRCPYTPERRVRF